MENPSFRFKREEHLKGRSRIREVFGKGKRYNVKHFGVSGTGQGAKLFVLQSNLPYNRICFSFSAGRKFGSAVARNRAKRLGREAYRLMKGQLAQGYDLILLFNANSGVKLSLSAMTELLLILFKKAGLLVC